MSPASEALHLPLEIEDIKAILPHRYPFLLLDRIIEMEEDRRVVGIKNVAADERYFIAGPGGRPVLPASILTEAMAQAGAVLILAKPENRARLIYFMGIDRVRYRRPVSPGDTVYLEGTVLKLRARIGSLKGVARVEGRVVCEGRMTFALGDPSRWPARSPSSVCARARKRSAPSRRDAWPSTEPWCASPPGASTPCATASAWTGGG
jgi:3-hydroxyacyl-[acyl-carrier-protein] dehydratase